MENVLEERLQALTWTINETEKLIRCQDDPRGRLRGLFTLWELKGERLRVLRTLQIRR